MERFQSPWMVPRGGEILNLLITLLLLSNLLAALVGSLFVLGFQRLRRWGKALIVWIEPNTKQLRIDYRRVYGGKISLPEKDILLEGVAKHGGKQSSWIVDPETGWNFIAPTRQETFDRDLKYAVLEPSNPASYHKAIRRQRWNDVLRAGEDTDKWARLLPMLGLIGIIALVIIMGALIWIAGKVSKAA